MAYDEALAARLRAVLADEPGLSEKRMFGGLGFMLDGTMAVAASNTGGLLLRVPAGTTEDHLAEDGTEPFVMRDRPMTGWIRVLPDAVSTDTGLRHWIAIGVATARALGPKTP